MAQEENDLGLSVRRQLYPRPQRATRIETGTDFKQFADKVTRLPVDQHLLMALVAPRPLLQPEGTQDTWTNPEGVQQTYSAAKKVYEFLGVKEKIGIRFRPVGHIPSADDLLDFADHAFNKKALPDAFGKLEYKTDVKAFSWDVPK